MKHPLLLALAIMLLPACKKEERNCYMCTQRVVSGSYTHTDTTNYCDKTDAEIRQIMDVALKGTVGSKYYLAKNCEKK